jgi:HAD superfamily hydrolase (TIGR01509 family)
MDLGNVTVRLRSAGFMERLRSHGDAARIPSDPWRLFLDPAFGFPDYERGRLDGPGFHARLKERLGLNLGYAAWLGLWNDYFEPNRPMEALLARLRGQVRVWGLSNTNPEHLAHLKLHFRVLDSFEGITASFEAGAAKPEPGIYAAALRALGVGAGEVLYLDDVAEYIGAAGSMGIPSFHYTFNDAALKARLLELGFNLPPLDGMSALACS